MGLIIYGFVYRGRLLSPFGPPKILVCKNSNRCRYSGDFCRWNRLLYNSHIRVTTAKWFSL